MKKLVLSLLVFVLLAMTVIGAVSANPATTTFVAPYRNGATYTVPAGNDITLRWFWYATARGLVNMFLGSFSASYAIYDQGGGTVFELPAAEADPIWGPIERIDPLDIGIDCAMPRIWQSVWQHDVIDLEPGTYTLITQWSYSHPVNDGAHVCRDAATGEPLAPPPSLIPPGSGAWTVTIVVQ